MTSVIYIYMYINPKKMCTGNGAESIDHFFGPCQKSKPGSALVAQSLKCLPAMQETWVRSMGPEEPLEKEMATHSTILAWRIP